MSDLELPPDVGDDGLPVFVSGDEDSENDELPPSVESDDDNSDGDSDFNECLFKRFFGTEKG